MSEWKAVKLKDVVSILGDGLHGTPIYNNIGEYFFINGNNLSEGHIVIKNDTKRVDFLEYDKYKKDLNDRTLLVSINGTIGNVATYKGEKCILGKSACYFNILPGVCKEYIYYILLHDNFQSYAKNWATGTTIKNVSLKQMREYEFLLPSFEKQQQIAKILSSLDDKIELNTQINHNLEEQAKAIYATYFPYSVDDALPDDWRKGTLGEIIDLHDSKRIPLSGNERGKMEKIYPYYGAASLMDYVNDYLFDGVFLLLGEDGTVVTDNGLPVLQYVWGKFWVNNHAHILTGKAGFSVESLLLLLKQTPVKSIVTGAVQPKISQANLKSIQIVIPPEKLLQEFNNVITPLFALIRQNSEESKHLAQLRDALLPKLMSGEIDVSEVEV